MPPEQPDPEIHKAKKRAWDRAAQRKLRQKTKARLEHLEKTVRVLEDDQHDAVVSALMAETEDLRKENERLHKIIESSISALQMAQEGAPISGSRCSAQPPNDRNTVASTSESEERGADIPGAGAEIAERTGSSGEETVQMLGTTNSFNYLDNTSWDFDSSIFNCSVGCDDESSLLPSAPCEAANADTMSVAHTAPTTMTATIATNFWAAPRQPGPKYLTSVACASEMAWSAANKIYETISGVDFTEILFADVIDAGPLLKGIHLGWNSLGPAYKRHPTIRILRQMDECLWASMPKINRAAIAYKSFMLLRYFLEPNDENLLAMPEWERPGTLQRCTDHPVAIGFFPWPALRERLILNHEYYRYTTFFARVRSDFSFTWPYSFEDMFHIGECPSHNYRASPLFVDHVRNLENWTMAPRFYQEFPELLGDIVDTSTSLCTKQNM